MGNCLCPGLLRALFRGQSLFLLIKPRGVVPLPGDALSAVKLKDPLCGVIQKVAVMGYRNDGAGESMQELLEPFHALSIKVVRRLIEQQHVGARKQKPAQSHTSLFTARQILDHSIPGREPQRIRCNFHLC